MALDELNEKCGVFGIVDHPQAAEIAAMGIHALQHRGQDAAGIASSDGTKLYLQRHRGLVSENFSNPSVIDTLRGSIAIGHTRYPTQGASSTNNIQPVSAEIGGQNFAIAHNGNITNYSKVKSLLSQHGSIFHSGADTEMIAHLMARSKHNQIRAQLIDALGKCSGAFSIVATDGQALYGARDPNGFRPLVLGKLDGAHVLASETYALQLIGADYLRDIRPGEFVTVENGELTSSFPFEARDPKFCVFEYVYFSRPDSEFNGIGVYQARKSIGSILATEAPAAGDVVVPVPDSGVPAALGYSHALGIPMDFGIIRSHYTGRTFIASDPDRRRNLIRSKLNANSQVIDGKRVILVDDSIVRGATSAAIVTQLRQAGASEVHVRIASPATISPCYFGVDTPDAKDLIASTNSVDEIGTFIGADSLAYLSIDGLYQATIGVKRDNLCPQFCDACFTSDYPQFSR